MTLGLSGASAHHRTSSGSLTLSVGNTSLGPVLPVETAISDITGSIEAAVAPQNWADSFLGAYSSQLELRAGLHYDAFIHMYPFCSILPPHSDFLPILLSCCKYDKNHTAFVFLHATYFMLHNGLQCHLLSYGWHSHIFLYL